MKRSFFWLIIFFIFFTTYTPKFNAISNKLVNIKIIIIEDNLVIKDNEIKQKLNFLYNENLLFLNKQKININLKKLPFVESVRIKKIYPNKIKLKIKEKKPIAILQKKKNKFYIIDSGNLIKFRTLDIYNNLPIVFGSSKNFYELYKDLQNIKFPITSIKSFYFFESGRWDLIMKNGKVIKLPIDNQIFSLKNYIQLNMKNNFENYKIIDYRIKDQLILN